MIKDLSDDWMKYIVQKNPDVYTLYLVQKKNNDKKEMIRSKYDDLIKPLQAKIKALEIKKARELASCNKIDALIDESFERCEY